MSGLESISVAVFLIVVVFFVLFCLYLSVKIFSFLIGKVEKRIKTDQETI